MPVGSGVARRRRTRVIVLVLASVMLLASVSSVSAQGSVPPVPRRPLGQDVPVYQPALGDPERRDAPSFQNPTGPLSLRDAVALALLNNPGLAAFAWEIRAREARVIQAGLRPNPILGVLAEDLGASRPTGDSLEQFVQPQATIQLSQVIELGGKRVARRELAVTNRDLAAWDYETARIDLLTRVSQALTDVLAAQETVALTEETTRLVEQVHDSVGARVVAGVVSPIEETRANVALAAVRVDLARARRGLEASRTRLALLWGSPEATFTAVAGDLKAEPAPLPSLTAIAARIDQNPELARWAAEMSQREAALALERSKAALDVTVVAGYRRFTDIGSNALLVGASIPLPFFDHNRGGIAEARSRLAKAHEERRAAQARVTAALADAYAALASAHDEVMALRTAVLPGSQQTFEAVSEGYRLGRFGYLDVLESQRTLIGSGGQYLRALSDYYKAIAEVERLIGEPLAGSATLPTTAKE
jgi:outer membrane protein, heavy metal efflux system